MTWLQSFERHLYNQKFERKVMSIILLLGFMIRLAFFFLVKTDFPDTKTYYEAGQSLFQTGFMQSDITMPLYPIWSYLLGGGRIQKFIEVLVSVMTIWVLARVSFEIFKSKLVQVLTALIMAGYPYLAYYSVTQLTETLFIFLMAISYLLFYRQRCGLAIFVLVFTILLRPTFDFVGPLVVLAFAAVVHHQRGRSLLKSFCHYIVLYLLVMAPWWIHNYSKYDRFVRLNLAEGYVWISGHNPLNQSGGGIQYEEGKGGDVDLRPYFENYSDPYERNQAMKKDAFDYIKSDIPHFLKMTGVKFLRFWRLYPYASEFSSPVYVIVSLFSFAPILILALISMAFYTKDVWLRMAPVFLFIAYLTFVHSVTIASLRYRLPLEPFLIMMAAFALKNIISRLAAMRG